MLRGSRPYLSLCLMSLARRSSRTICRSNSTADTLDHTRSGLEDASGCCDDMSGPTNVNQKRAFDADAFLRSAGVGKTVVTYQRAEVIFSQGDASDSVMYIQKGAVKLSVLSPRGKEAVVAMLGPGDFFGERALTGHPVRLDAASEMAATAIVSA